MAIAIVSITSFRSARRTFGTPCRKGIPPDNAVKDSTAPTVQALALVTIRAVYNDSPRWRDLASADFLGMHGKVVVDGRRILRREAMDGVELVVLGG